MENLALNGHLDHASLFSFDDHADNLAPDAEFRSPGRAVAVPPPSYKISSVMDGLDVYAAVYGCSATSAVTR